jgi:hypothetical protein
VCLPIGIAGLLALAGAILIARYHHQPPTFLALVTDPWVP